MTITNINGHIIVRVPEYQLQQELNPQTGFPFVSEAEAQAWLDAVLPKLQADMAKQLAGTPVIDVAAVQKMRLNRLMAINVICETKIDQVKMTYPVTERETWDMQIAEAHEYLATPTTAVTPFLTVLAVTRGETVEILAKKVLANQAALKQFTAHIIGQRHLCDKALKAISDSDPDASSKIDAVVWPE